MRDSDCLEINLCLIFQTCDRKQLLCNWAMVGYHVLEKKNVLPSLVKSNALFSTMLKKIRIESIAFFLVYPVQQEKAQI